MVQVSDKDYFITDEPDPQMDFHIIVNLMIKESPDSNFDRMKQKGRFYISSIQALQSVPRIAQTKIDRSLSYQQALSISRNDNHTERKQFREAYWSVIF